jgi:hypothetical protein
VYTIALNRWRDSACGTAVPDLAKIAFVLAAMIRLLTRRIARAGKQT